MDSPVHATAEQFVALERAGGLAVADAPVAFPIRGDEAMARVKLTRRAIALVMLTW